MSDALHDPARTVAISRGRGRVSRPGAVGRRARLLALPFFVVLVMATPTILPASGNGSLGIPPAPIGESAPATSPLPVGPRDVGASSALPTTAEVSLPGLGPGALAFAKDRGTAPLPWTVPAIEARIALPTPPYVAPSSPSIRPLPAGPTDVNLSGTATLVIASDTTVLNVSLHNHAILYVHSATIRPTLTVLGNIRLYDQSVLFVNASNLAIGESYNVEWNIQVMGSAQFAMVYSNLTTNGYQWGAAYEENANVTFLSSLVGYPTGWLDSSLIGAARLTVLGSWYSSDVILFDNAFAPSTANFSAANSAGFNVWLNFKWGTSANLSLPGLTGWRNWSFPAGAA
ncbi:MAG: hypothetical protein L3J73_04660, partial [Thermoplasmata archaeon]|nr:hypothetical protein [Thermoplasmata archaeon]